MWLGNRKNSGSARTRKRAHERFTSDILICPLGDVIDVSGSGIRLRCKGRNKFAIGMKVSLELRVPDGQLKLPARVARIERTGFLSCDVGFEFVGVTPKLVHALKGLAQYGFVMPICVNAAADGDRKANEVKQSAKPKPDPVPALDPNVIWARVILDVKDDASAEDVQRAYRKLAMTCHPDANPGPDAERRFAEIGQAHRILRDAMREATRVASFAAGK